MMSCFAWPAWGEPRKLSVRGCVHVAGGNAAEVPSTAACPSCSDGRHLGSRQLLFLSREGGDAI